ncbi:MAG TPA: pseudouridine synthase [Candidatus Saccharimonadales bacterium]|nr:pseudouridine synthase [Candidatus Saccharimonadales bacterium]
MRINRYVALATGMSRRAADAAIAEGRVLVGGQKPGPGDAITEHDKVTIDGRAITPPVNTLTLILNKPVGYVVSREGQGSKTIYDILPAEYHNLKPVGRLDKDSSGLLLLTNDGQLAHELTHPSRQKTKIYEVELDKPLASLHQQMITDHGISLDDGRSQFLISKIDTAHSVGGERSEPGEEQADASKPVRGAGAEKSDAREERAGSKRSDAGTRGGASPSSIMDARIHQITMHEGRNRQIRRTFAALGYKVTKLHRTHFGPYRLDNLPSGKFTKL